MNEEKILTLCGQMAAALPLLRKAMGTTQAQFAALAGVTRNTVIRMEKSGTMGWNTYLSLLMIFTGNRNTEKLISALELYPPELDEFFAGRTVC